jgi:hypothetical protein
MNLGNMPLIPIHTGLTLGMPVNSVQTMAPLMQSMEGPRGTRHLAGRDLTDLPHQSVAKGADSFQGRMKFTSPTATQSNCIFIEAQAHICLTKLSVFLFIVIVFFRIMCWSS